MKTLSYTELDALAGEVLPERAVLSTLLVSSGDGGDSYNNNNGGGFGHNGGSTIAQNACQSHISKPDSGLLQLVGLHAQNDHQSFTCAPGTTVSGH